MTWARDWREDAPPLRHYQDAAVEWMSKRGSYGLFDEMRLGKTATVLRDFCGVRATAPDARLLIVAPNNVLENWRAEVGKWTTLSVEVATGTARQRKAAITASSDVTVVAYDNLDRELWALNDNRYYMGAFDESHALKGYKTKRTQAAHGLRLARRACVTATPMLNRVDELWSQLHLVAPTAFGSYWQFVNRYAVFGGFENRQIVGVQNVAELRAAMGLHCLRRLRREVMADLPEITPVDIYVPLNPAQQAMYNVARDELKVAIDTHVIDEFSSPLTRLIRLRQIIGTPACFGAPDDSAILDEAERQIEGTDPARKIVVFTQFLDVAAAMKRRLDASGTPAHLIQGDGMSIGRRAEVIAQFSADSSRVLIATYGVAMQGIDLSAADLGVCLDVLWVPDLQRQAESRMVNVARKQVPEIVRIHGAKTVAARVMKVLSSKSTQNATVLDANDFEKRLEAQLNLRELLDE